VLHLWKNFKSEKSLLQTFVKQNQGCQMVHFQTKISILVNFWRALEWKMLV
jgi:hypothetical protein